MFKILWFLFFISFPVVSNADITTGLVGWWKLNEGSGASTIDSSGSGNTGTLENSPTWVNGRLGSGLLFNGSNQRVTAAVNRLPSGTSPRTLCGWIYITQYANYNIGFDYGGGGQGGIFGYYLSGSTLHFWGNNDDINTGDSVSLNQWHHIAITFDGSLVGMYLDGVEVLTPTAPPVALNTGTTGMYIGYSINGDWFPGVVDDVRVYNRVLTAQDIKTLYSGDNKINSGVIQSWQQQN